MTELTDGASRGPRDFSSQTVASTGDDVRGVSANHETLKALAGKFCWIDPISAPDAPGFYFFGGEVDPADFGMKEGAGLLFSVSGKGTSPSEAFESCAGEGAEYLSRLEWGTEALTTGDPRGVPHGHDEAALGALLEQLGPDRSNSLDALDWIAARRLSDGSEVLVPADLCLSRPDALSRPQLPSALSTGCAAGPTREIATLSALLELVERDAAALWWSGGRRGRSVSQELIVRTGIAELLAGLRRDCRGRATWLLDITSDIEIPCIVAISVADDGRSFASGVAARMDPGEAMRASLLELCQIELGHHIVAAKRKVRGDEALNEADRRKLRRSQELDVQASKCLFPDGPPRSETESASHDPSESIAVVTARLQSLNIEPLVVNLTRTDLGVPAVRALAPGLQPYPSSISTERLAHAIADHRTAASHDVGIPLF